MPKKKMKNTKTRIFIKPIFAFLLIYTLRLVVSNILRIRFGLKLLRNDTKKLKGSYVILGNHLNNWDGSYLQIFTRRLIHYVATDSLFRHKWAGPILRVLDYIPKTKFVSDINTIRKIMEIKNRKGVIGIFPEGMCSWNGITQPIALSTARLIKSLKVPVINAKIRGGYFSKPRWANHSRRGRVTLSMELLFTAQQVKDLSTEEIHKIIIEAMQYDAFENQAKNPIRFKGRAKAEKMEMFLFACPSCRKIGTMKSEGDRFYCTNCSLDLEYDDYGNLVNKEDPDFEYSNPHKWDEWQKGLLKNYLDNDVKVWFTDNYSILSKSYQKGKPYKHESTGDFTFTREKLIFKGYDDYSKDFYIDNIIGVYTQFQNGFAFRYNNEDYLLTFDHNSKSAYKWTQGVKLVSNKELKGE